MVLNETSDAVPHGLVGFANFKRSNPLSDKFGVVKFHHVEFWCHDAVNTSSRFSWGLGMPTIAKSDMSTGNQTYSSFALRSNDLTFVFSAPYSTKLDQAGTKKPIPNYDAQTALSFFTTHGLGVRAVAIEVKDAVEAFTVSVANGAKAVSEPMVIPSEAGGSATISEVSLYGDVVMRFVSFDNFQGLFLPLYEKVENSAVMSHGLQRIDHVVGNVPVLMDAIKYVARFTGFHEFAEFTAEDVGTVDSGLNSMVLASNNEMVLLPMNEPTHGTKRKSQIQTYLDHNEGPGVQHMALLTKDIFHTLREMRGKTELGGFDFMPRPSAKYYAGLPDKIGDVLSAQQLQECQKLGILVDKDDQGVLLQIFTKPLGDRPTIFLEIIQRVGCLEKSPAGEEVQKGGCGGFGKGNFSELFKSIEDFERTLEVA
eukprot:TRINITY_DN32930_c0_g1_i1.p1 TRINITY_DN32930_c0_g1~~TRINITY_DN32930_c0_g1_i1.p1  ORF type:complete len:425 (-),score=78.19 TRINITY_DN32930_c0_g1_i1:1320-2594(-)